MPILYNDTGFEGPDDSTISTLLCCERAISRLQLSGGFITYNCTLNWRVGVRMRWEVSCLTTTREMNEKLPCGSLLINREPPARREVDEKQSCDRASQDSLSYYITGRITGIHSELGQTEKKFS